MIWGRMSVGVEVKDGRRQSMALRTGQLIKYQYKSELNNAMIKATIGNLSKAS
jgi:hypothetical protein